MGETDGIIQFGVECRLISHRKGFNGIKTICSTCGILAVANGCFIKFKSYKFRDGELVSRR